MNKALEAEAALASYLVSANLWPGDQRVLEQALKILRKEAGR